jgi:hypothetical protein
LRAIAPSATFPILTQRDIGDLAFVLPLLEEQRPVCEYLDRETNKIDRAIGTIEGVTDRVQEYRTTLTAAAVTGKTDLCETIHVSSRLFLLRQGERDRHAAAVLTMR